MEKRTLLTSFHWRLCLLGLLSYDTLRAPVNCRSTQSFFQWVLYKLATVRLRGYHHLVSTAATLCPSIYFCSHSLSCATFSQPGLFTHQAPWIQCWEPGDFQRLTGKNKYWKKNYCLQDTTYNHTPLKLKWINLELNNKFLKNSFLEGLLYLLISLNNYSCQTIY